MRNFNTSPPPPPVGGQPNPCSVDLPKGGAV